MAKTQDGGYLIGIDVGGTHTDLALSHPDGIVRSKALTTHDDYSKGVLDAIDVVAEDLGIETKMLLAQSDALINGTTIVTNAITEVKGARVGVLVTSGFADTFRVLGGTRRTAYDDHVQMNPPEIVRHEDIVEIDERMDVDGNELVPLDEEGLRAGAQRLRDAGVEGIAVCFLWSFKHDAHEQRAREIVQEVWPEVFVTLSSEIHPVIREYERFLTAVFNCFCQPAASALLNTLGARLTERGFSGSLSFFAGAGGAISRATAERFPILLLHSGPAGGVIGATRVAELLGATNVIVGDMGGTSFDTALVQDGRPTIAPRVTIDVFETGISVVDVVSVGAGGGSLGWIDDRGVPQVGPKSAGSMPGPACYGRGGQQPTVTDAAVVMGLIDPKRYLGGRMELDVDAARNAMSRVFPPDAGWIAESAAEAMVELTCTNMAHALRRVSVERGHDPREFTFLAYGGTLPFFATRICEKMGMHSVIIPPNSAVFSAFGLLTADYVRRYNRSIEWDLSEADDVDRINRIREQLIQEGMAEAADDGIDTAHSTIEWTGEFRFTGQVFEVAMELPSRLLTPDDAHGLAQAFPEIYERAYGKGTGWKNSSVVLLTVSMTLKAKRPKPSLHIAPEGDHDPGDAHSGRRPVYSHAHGERVEFDIYAEDRVTPGMTISGPAIVEAVDTTIVVSHGWKCRRDGLGAFALTRVDEVRKS